MHWSWLALLTLTISTRAPPAHAGSYFRTDAQKLVGLIFQANLKPLQTIQTLANVRHASPERTTGIETVACRQRDWRATAPQANAT